MFDPQMGIALSAIHDRVNSPWTVESLAEAAGMSRSAFAARFKELLGQTPLEYVTEWRMQKAMPLLQQRDKKLIDVARLVGYESDAALSKAFKRVVGATLVNTLDAVFEDQGHGGRFSKRRIPTLAAGPGSRTQSRPRQTATSPQTGFAWVGTKLLASSSRCLPVVLKPVPERRPRHANVAANVNLFTVVADGLVDNSVRV